MGPGGGLEHSGMASYTFLLLRLDATGDKAFLANLVRAISCFAEVGLGTLKTNGQTLAVVSPYHRLCS